LVTWSSLHGRDASSHEISLSNPELLIFFQNSRWRPPPSWICFGETWDHPRCLIHGAYFLQKSCHDRLGSFQVIRISIFFSFRFGSAIHAPKISVLGDFTPIIYGHIVQTPKRHFLAWHDAFRALIGPDLTHSATCGLGKKKQKKKEKKTVRNWLFAQTTHVAVSKSKFACRVASSVYCILDYMRLCHARLCRDMTQGRGFATLCRVGRGFTVRDIVCHTRVRTYHDYY